MQIIQSLGEAMNWLEREISWGANPSELRHLMGRIGELYVAMYTNGNMAENVNERGYDVVTRDNEKISVKTTTRLGSQGHILFNSNTINHVDRVIIIRFNPEEMELEILLDEPIEKVKKIMSKQTDGKLSIAMSKINKSNNKVRDDKEIPIIRKANYQNYTIQELESGSIEIYVEGEKQLIVKPILREIANLISVSIFNAKGNPYNTRQLGTLIIKQLSKGDRLYD